MIKRGEIYFAQLNPVVGSEQGGIRPVLVIQNDIGNQYSPTTIVLAITSQINKAKLPTHVELKAEQYGLERDSVILAEQIRTIDKTRLKQRIAVLDEEMMNFVDQALASPRFPKYSGGFFSRLDSIQKTRRTRIRVTMEIKIKGVISSPPIELSFSPYYAPILKSL
jgi:mRNA interferase MazF